MGNKVLIAECGLRVLSLVFAAMAAAVIGLDTQTKTVFMISRKASVKDLEALWIMTIVTAVAAGYHLLQLLGCVTFAWLGRHPWQCTNKFAAWLYFFLDQGVTYVTFAATMAGLQASLVAVFGVGGLQWSKLCNIYTRYCQQIAGGMVCATAASIDMAIISAVSAHRLFSLYPHHLRRRPSSKTG